MSSVAGPLHVSSILRTMAKGAPGRDSHRAARQLAGLDPKSFLTNLQQAATNRSPHAIAALKADMYELDALFHQLSRAGHDVSAALHDFQILKQFVSQVSSSEKSRHSSSHHRSGSFPSISSPPSRSDLHQRSVNIEQGHHRSARPPIGPPRSAPGSLSSSLPTQNSTILSPVPHRLTKQRRMSAPPVPAMSNVPKKVHFASHATVYTFASTDSRTASAVMPPSRPACVPRVVGSVSADGRARF